MQIERQGHGAETDVAERPGGGPPHLRPVYVAGVGMTPFGKRTGQTLKDLAGAAVREAASDAGLPLDRVQVAYFANAMAGLLAGQEMIRGQVALRDVGIRRVPVFNVENACASASSAFHLAWQGVAAGIYDVALAVGAEKMVYPDKGRTLDGLRSALDVDQIPEAAAEAGSPLMELYAQEARDYLEHSDATVRDFAAIAAKNQRHGALNPNAQHGGEVSIEEVLASREIARPLTLLMCSPISDGAAAAVLVSESLARTLGAGVRVVASALASALEDEARAQGVRVASAAAGRAYEVAALGPRDVAVAEVHDAAASAELMVYEDVGLAPFGEGARLIRDGATDLGGRVPVNTSGGLLARGHPIGATGLAQIHEIVLQLSGRAGPRQVEGARVGLTENGGGCLDGDNAAAAVHLFVRD